MKRLLICIIFVATNCGFSQSFNLLLDDAVSVRNVLAYDYKEIENIKEQNEKMADDLNLVITILKKYQGATTSSTPMNMYNGGLNSNNWRSYQRYFVLIYRPKRLVNYGLDKFKIDIIKDSLKRKILEYKQDVLADENLVKLTRVEKGVDKIIPNYHRNLDKLDSCYIDLHRTNILSSLLILMEYRGYYSTFKNFFLRDICDQLLDKFTQPNSLATQNNQSFIVNNTDKSLIGMTGSAAFTTVVDGLSKFVAERMKQELAIVFVDHFRNFITKYNNKYYVKIFQVLFPNTVMCIQTLDVEQYASLPMLMKQNAEKDISAILENISHLSDVFPRVGPGLKFVFTSFDLIHKLSVCERPYEFLSQVANNKLMDELRLSNNPKIQNISSSFQILDLVSSSLLTRQGNMMGYVNPDYFMEVSSDKTFRSCYLGLLYQKNLNKYGGIQFYGSNPLSVTSVLDKMYSNSANVDTIFYSIQRVADLCHKLHEASSEISKTKKNGNKITYGEILLYYNYSIEVLVESKQLANSFYRSLNPAQQVFIDEANFTRFIKIAKELGKVYQDIHEKRYIQASVTALRMLEPMMGMLSSSETPEVLTNLIKYTSFISEVALAENSDQVRDAIKSIALPPGSYQIKRKNAFNVSFNAYPGWYIGYQVSIQNDKIVDGANYGFTAPVGLAFNFGCRTKTSKQTSYFNNNFRYSTFSIFIPLVDIGAPVMFRVNNSDQQNVFANFDYLNFISPGLYTNWGFAKLPISLNVGFQYYPKVLHESQFRYNSFRVGAAITVDIPIVNFKTRPFKNDFK